MGYFKDMLNVMLLKDDTYKKIGNDRKAFGRFSVTFLAISYVLTLLVSVLLFFVFIPFLSKFLPISPTFSPSLTFGLIMLMPFISYLSILLFTLIPHIIGLIFGGKPRKYTDFVKVLHYPLPVIGTITKFIGLGVIYKIWLYFVLYKTYRIIHKLSPKRAGWAVVVNVILALIVVSVVAFMYLKTVMTIFALAGLSGGSTVPLG